MSQIITLIILLVKCTTLNSQPFLRQWLSTQTASISVPVTYLIHLEADNGPFRKIKRSVTEDIKTEETYISSSEIITTSTATNRDKRTVDKSPGNRNKHGPNLNVKAGLRYHHQQRHSNGSVSGSYATLDPKGSLQVMHYVSDDKGYREYPEIGEPGSQASAQNHHLQFQQRLPPPAQRNINIVTSSNVGNQQINTNPNNHTRRDVNPIGDNNFNFVPSIASPYNVPSQVNLANGLPVTPILHSAVSSVSQFAPRSPLFDKYYRPSPEEVQRSYEYHRMRSSLDPGAFRPPEANAVPDVIRDKPMELRGVYNEYQTPYSVRYHEDTPSGYYVYNPPVEDTRYYNTPQYAPPQIPVDMQAPIPPPQDLYPRGPPQNYYPPPEPPQNYYPPPAPPQNYYPLSPSPQQFQQPYPENVPAQPPIYVQSFDQQAFPPQEALPPGNSYPPDNSFPPGNAIPPGNAYPPANSFPPNNGFAAAAPYISNSPTFNQPFPSGIPIYEAPAPQNVPTYSLPPPNNIPVYNQPPPQPPPNAYNQNQNQNVYYASGSAPQPKKA